MSCCGSLTRALVIASALRADSDGASPPQDRLPSVRLPNSSPKAPTSRRRTPAPPAKQQRKPSLMEIERAIGAGKFKDRNLSEKEENKTMFDSLLLDAMREDDSEVQKKLRETGEWIADGTENAARSSGKLILLSP
uniref:Uncharacterized protein n=1 Tax=Kalanchoe fedtschenkoi TaxID=63787 RepID=A0A7N0UEG8_KALFE